MSRPALDTPTDVPAHAASRRRSRARAEAPAFVDDYLAALLAQASHLISTEFHRIVRARGLSVPEWRVLATLAGGRALPIGRIAQICVIKQPTLTRQLDRMAQRGEVERLPHGSDRRIVLVRITPLGSRMVEDLIGRASEHERRVLAPFGLARARALKKVLRQIIDLHQTTA